MFTGENIAREKGGLQSGKMRKDFYSNGDGKEVGEEKYERHY
jgi:hypothetical protein